jgi:hypothetical protein
MQTFSDLCGGWKTEGRRFNSGWVSVEVTYQNVAHIRIVELHHY